MSQQPRDAVEDDDKQTEDEIEQESASVLPSREAMSIVDPTLVMKGGTTITDPSAPSDPIHPQDTTGQGIDEGDPSGSA